MRDLRYLKIGVLSLALSALPIMAQDRPQDQKPNSQNGSATTQASPDNGNADTSTRPNAQDRDHTNSAATQSDMQDRNKGDMDRTTAQADRRDTSADDTRGTQRASSGGGYGLWGLLGLLGLLGFGRRNRAGRSDIETTTDMDTRDRDIRRVA
jgi:hypothetical protein